MNLVVGHRIYPVWGRGNGCPRLKVLQVPEKECPMNVCDLKIRFDRYACIKFQRRGTQFGLHLECVFFKDRSDQVKKGR